MQSFTKENFQDTLEKNAWKEEMQKLHLESEKRQFKREKEREKKQEKFFKYQAKILQKLLMKKHYSKKSKGKSVPGKNLAKNLAQTDGCLTGSDEEWLPSSVSSSNANDDSSSNLDEFLSLEAAEEEHEDFEDDDRLSNATNEGASGSKEKSSLEEYQNRGETSPNIFKPFKSALRSAKKSLSTLSIGRAAGRLKDDPVPDPPKPKEDSAISYVVRFELEIDSHPIDQEKSIIKQFSQTKIFAALFINFMPAF